MKHSKILLASVMAVGGLGVWPMAQEAGACSRIVYKGLDDLYVVGRSLDWKTPIPTNLYVYPRGMEKVSSELNGALSWTSRYGAVYAVSYNGGITEGMNEKGLVMNSLFCKGTVYVNDKNLNDPPMSMAVFVAWVVDQCATTDEAAALLRDTPFHIQGATFDGGTAAALHFGITDASGKSVIVEYNEGVMSITDMGEYQAMTNDPQWSDMKSILSYWDKIGGTHMLPGTVSSPDRCVRANFFITHVKPVAEAELGMSICRSVLVNVSVPYTYMIEGEPNVSSTQWRSYANLRDKLYGFEVVTNTGYYWVDLTKMDLKPGASVMKLNVAESNGLTGEVNKHLKKSAPFNPMW